MSVSVQQTVKCDGTIPTLAGTKAFLIHNTHRSLCLEDTVPAGEVLLKKCNQGSESQQWVWVDQSMLMCVASSRCLSAQHREPVQTQSCLDLKVDTAGLMWDCDRDRLISRNTSMLLSIDGQRLTLSQDSRHSKWRSLDEGDICQEKLSKSVRTVMLLYRLFSALWAICASTEFKLNLYSPFLYEGFQAELS